MSQFDDEDIVQIGIKLPASLYMKLKFFCFMNRTTYADLIREFLAKELKEVRVPKTTKAAA